MDTSPMKLPYETGDDVLVTVPRETWAFLSSLREEIETALDELEDHDE